jgi:hypothetical protein
MAMGARERVGERREERVDHLRRLAELRASRRAAPRTDVRRLAHVLGAADEHGLGLAEEDLLGAVDDGLEARAAEAVDRERGTW